MEWQKFCKNFAMSNFKHKQDLLKNILASVVEIKDLKLNFLHNFFWKLLPRYICCRLDKKLLKTAASTPHNFLYDGSVIENLWINWLNVGGRYEFSQDLFIMGKHSSRRLQGDVKLIANCAILYCIYTLQLAR